ncbi:ACY1.2 family protein [Megaselia abdita]
MKDFNTVYCRKAKFTIRAQRRIQFIINRYSVWKIFIFSLKESVCKLYLKESHEINLSKMANKEIEIFREFLRIPSVHPNINYDSCVQFLKKQAESLNLPLKVNFAGDPTKPIVVITFEGSQPELSSIMLNCHMDVVPVDEDKWVHPPFSAHMDEEGRIFARGSQDMKCLGTQYLAVIRELQKSGTKLKRTLHLTFVPDEEIGGKFGMQAFVHTTAFKDLNIGFAIDEGTPEEDDVYKVYFAERTMWHIHFHINGTAGHGSRLLENTAAEKAKYLINKFSELRAREAKKLIDNPDFTDGDVTSINLTRLDGGVQTNVIPSKISLGYDIRIALEVDIPEFEKEIQKWCEEAGGDIEIVFEIKEPVTERTKLDNTNIYWTAFKQGLESMKLKHKARVMAGGTDIQYLRALNIPAIGFSPIINTPVLLHDHNEFLTAEMYLLGIKIWKEILMEVANV